MNPKYVNVIEHVLFCIEPLSSCHGTQLADGNCDHLYLIARHTSVVSQVKCG
jgi:hypothetical protein